MTNASFFTTECEFQQCHSASGLAGTKAAALWVNAVAACQRGLGYGRSIFDRVITIISREYFHLVARYPADQQLLFVMLMTRGLASAGRICADRVGLMLVLAKSRWYATGDALISYGSLAPE